MYQVEYFKVLSTNIDSVRAKFDEITVFVEELRKTNFEFSAICLQECHLTAESDMSLLQIDGYKCLLQGKTCSNKGGLIIYLNEKYKFKTRTDLYRTSPIWEGQFIDITGNGLTKGITLGNIYRPPRNLNENLSVFIDELSQTLILLERSKNEVLLAGDYNINLLKLHEKPMFKEFFDTIISHSFIPQITLPTRFSNKNGTLIDNIFCKLSDSTLQSTSGILTQKLSDHQPYFTCLNTKYHNDRNPKYIKCYTNSEEAVKNTVRHLQSTKIISKLVMDENGDPNTNYNILHDIVENAINTHMPCKTVKFKKYKHKKHQWITQGILISIRYRDNLYRNMRKTQPGTPEYETIKRNLTTYNGILKKNIRMAKKWYYAFIFNKYKDNIKKTWSSINYILNRTKKKKYFPEFFSNK